jgi:hypothetical protein
LANLIWSSDLYKGYTSKYSDLIKGSMDDIKPFQRLSAKEKTIDWIKAVADFYDAIGWENVSKRAAKIQKNYWMRYGKLNPSDYIINPDVNPLSEAIGMIVPKESQSPLEKFYSLAPNLVDVMRGEYVKMDHSWTVEAIDPFSHDEIFNQKNEDFKSAVMQHAESVKAQTLASMGITEETAPEDYSKAMDETRQRLTEIEFKYKNFRTTGTQWAEKVMKIHEKRYNLQELQPDAFESGLITDSEFWHLDMGEDDFRVELLNPKWCDYFKGPGTKYVSKGDYFLWFDFGSAGDVIDKYGRIMKEEDIDKLKDVFVDSVNMIVPDQLKNIQGSYYDRTKPWSVATDLNPARNDSFLGKELAASYPRSGNFDHNIDRDIFAAATGDNHRGQPRMFRIMTLYWRSMQKIGWLTKINRDGSSIEPTWVDENFIVTEKPVYDKSKLNQETADNLLYGEHIDWTWAPQWRKVIKVSPNGKHSFWLDSEKKMDAIYLDGGPTPFQLYKYRLTFIY